MKAFVFFGSGNFFGIFKGKRELMSNGFVIGFKVGKNFGKKKGFNNELNNFSVIFNMMVILDSCLVVDGSLVVEMFKLEVEGLIDKKILGDKEKGKKVNNCKMDKNFFKFKIVRFIVFVFVFIFS